VFLVNSRHPLVCATHACLRRHGSRFFRSYAGNLPSSFNIVLSSALVFSTSPPVSVSGTVYTLGLFPGRLRLPVQSNKNGQRAISVTTSRPWNINQVPIDYGFRPRLRGRLTLRGLALRRNPWTFGDSVSHAVCRYLCQHSRFRYLQQSLRITFTGLRNAPLPQARSGDRTYPQLRCVALAPIHFRRRMARPVSYYAFFKGWLLLSQPPGCHSLPTSFPT
jgi:hypothetical protein